MLSSPFITISRSLPPSLLPPTDRDFVIVAGTAGTPWLALSFFNQSSGVEGGSRQPDKWWRRQGEPWRDGGRAPGSATPLLSPPLHLGWIPFIDEPILTINPSRNLCALSDGRPSLSLRHVVEKATALERGVLCSFPLRQQMIDPHHIRSAESLISILLHSPSFEFSRLALHRSGRLP